MPKSPTYVVAWSDEIDAYQVFAHGDLEQTLSAENEAFWLSWLEAHSSFSFQGRQGRLSLLKEARIRGESYWYAYSYANQRTRKRYIGSSIALSVFQLEEIAQTFKQTISPVSPQVPDPVMKKRVPRPLPGSQLPLRKAKFATPYLSPSLIERPRLLTLLNSALECKLTLFTAPTGFGKTTLVTQWLTTLTAHPTQPATAWLSLSVEDNEVFSFWRYIISACQRLQPALGSSALAALTVHPSGDELEQALTLLLNDLANLDRCSLLVIDNYSVIVEKHLHELWTTFLEQLPPMLHILLLSRSEPPLPLLRWRARGELYDLRAIDLRFSQAETSAFLQQALSYSCSEEAIRKVDGQMEGWVAGLRLLTLAMRGKQTSQHANYSLLTTNDSLRSIQDYFVDELLSTESEDVQRFILQTSMLPRLSGSLCDVLLQQVDSALLLETLKQAGFFLEELDLPGETERWYRYYTPFADAMQAEASRRLGPAEMLSLSLTASRWFEQHELFFAAVEISLRSHDFERAASIIEQMTEVKKAASQAQMFDFHELDPLYLWMERLPEEVLRRHPTLCFSYACVLLYTFVVDQVPMTSDTVIQIEHCLNMAQMSWEEVGDLSRLGEVLAYRALLARQYGALEEAVALAHRSLEYLYDETSRWRMISLSVLGADVLLSGQLNLARQIFQPRYPFLAATQGRAFARPGVIMFSRVCIEQLDFHQAEAALTQLLAEARADNDDDDIADAQLGLAQISYAWNDLDTAEQQAREALMLGQKLENEETKAYASLILVQNQHIKKGAAQALQLCQELLSWVQPNGVPMRSWHHRAVQAQQAQLQLASGDLAAVERWIAARQQYDAVPPLLQLEREDLLIARWHIACGAFTEAQALLEPALQSAEAAGRKRNALDMYLLLALIASAQKHLSEAKRLLQQVLAHASGANYQRLLLNEGPSIAPLIQSCLPALQGETLISFVRSLLQTLVQESTLHSVPLAYLIEPLSTQELRVLRLLVAGCSNPEIAAELVVSINTIKSHAQNIYRKLNVENRVEASKVARHLNLL